MSALRHVLRRAGAAAATVLLVSLLLFVAVRVLPADPVAMSVPPGAGDAAVAAARAHMAADSILPVQFAVWLGQVATGDLGDSVLLRRPAGELLRAALPATLELAGLALLGSLAVGLAGGVLLFVMRGTARRAMAETTATLMMSVPEFLWALGFVLVFGVLLDALPFIGRIGPELRQPSGSGFLLLDTLLAGSPRGFASAAAHLVLPVGALVTAFAPPVARVMHAALAEAWRQEHIRHARLRGLGEAALWGHALRNALLPTLGLMGTQIALLFGGVVLVEEIFTFPGLGNLLVDGVRNGDLPVVQAAGLGFCAVVLLANAAVHVLHRALDPLAVRR